MAVKNTILLTSTSIASQDFVFSQKQKGAGYRRLDNPLHTAVFAFDNFQGAVKIQATLVLYPGESDWFDVEYDSGDAIETDGSSLLTALVRNFTGNFIWIRAAYRIEQGTITEIRYSV